MIKWKGHTGRFGPFKFEVENRWVESKILWIRLHGSKKLMPKWRKGRHEFFSSKGLKYTAEGSFHDSLQACKKSAEKWLRKTLKEIKKASRET